METEGTIARCSPDLDARPAAALEPSVNSTRSPKAAAAPADGCFDCNICLEFAADPVVTLCGHLFCWPCIFRWLQLDAAGPRRCPVCKSPLSESSLVPLYGCGQESHPRHHDAGIPERPRDHRNFVSPDSADDHRPSLPSRQEVQIYRNYYSDEGLSNDTGILAFAMLPWGFRKRRCLNRQPAMTAAAAGGRGRRRQELIESWFNQLWGFLFCFAVLGFLIF